MFTFESTTIVPASVINAIGLRIKETFLELLPEDTSDETIYQYSTLLNQAVGECIGNDIKRCDRWSLERRQSFKIAELLRNNKRIEAIKLFRQFTGVGLREGMHFIDTFGIGHAAADVFINAFT